MREGEGSVGEGERREVMRIKKAQINDLRYLLINDRTTKICESLIGSQHVQSPAIYSCLFGFIATNEHSVMDT